MASILPLGAGFGKRPPDTTRAIRIGSMSHQSSHREPRGLRAPVAERRAVFALTGLAIAQPIYDILGRTPEFLAVRGISGPSLWALARTESAG